MKRGAITAALVLLGLLALTAGAPDSWYVTHDRYMEANPSVSVTGDGGDSTIVWNVPSQTSYFTTVTNWSGQGNNHKLIWISPKPVFNGTKRDTSVIEAAAGFRQYQMNGIPIDSVGVLTPLGDVGSYTYEFLYAGGRKR